MSDNQDNSISCMEFRDRLKALIERLVSVYNEANKEFPSLLQTYVPSEDGSGCKMAVYMEGHKDAESAVTLRFVTDDSVINLMLFHNYAIEMINLIHRPERIQETRDVMKKRFDRFDKLRTERSSS